MYVESLEISKQPSYASNPGQYLGKVCLEGSTGKQEIILSSAAISRVFTLIAEEVCNRAKSNAAQVKSGMDEAIHAPLLSQSGVISGELL